MRDVHSIHSITLFSVFILTGCTAEPVPLRSSVTDVSTTDATVSIEVDALTAMEATPDSDVGDATDLSLSDTGSLADSDVVSIDGGSLSEGDVGIGDDAMVSDAGMASDANYEPPTCRVEGPEPSSFCTGASQDEYYCDAFGGEPVVDPTAIGSTQPFWVLQDLQPQSCGFEQYYGLEGFHGTPTMMVLLWAGCGFCQAQTVKLQQMHYELQAMGVVVHFVIIDQSSENPPIEYLTDRCNFPILQDESGVNAWSLQGGRKDDFYFYDSNGILKNFIPSTDDVALTSYEDPPMDPTSGYTNIKNAVLDLVEHDGEPPVIPEPMEPSDGN